MLAKILNICPNNDIHLTTLLNTFDINSSVFARLIEGITERDLRHFKKDSNYIPWLIGSQVQLRYELANLLGIDETQTAKELFSNNKAVQYDVIYPPIFSFNNDWKRISPRLRNLIQELNDEDLFTCDKKNPAYQGTLFDLLSFITQRESQSISTITLWRGLLT